jgi:hypothetical protein
MFNDSGWIEERTRRQAQRQQAWLARARRPVVIEIGAGSAIPSVRYFSQHVLTQHNGRLIRINPRESQVPGRLDVGLACGSLAGLSAIDDLLA